MPDAAGFTGHLGVNVIRPAGDEQAYTVLVRFDNLDNLYRWIHSPLRKQYIEEVTPLLLESDHIEIRPGAEFWFTPPNPGVRQPPQWKQFIITLLVIFPSTNLVPWFWGWCCRSWTARCSAIFSMTPPWSPGGVPVDAYRDSRFSSMADPPLGGSPGECYEPPRFIDHHQRQVSHRRSPKSHRTGGRHPRRQVSGGRQRKRSHAARRAGNPVIDLHGHTAIPGLNDSHLHLIRGGLNYNPELRWEGVPSLADALRMLKEQALRTPNPQWVRVVGGWTEFQFAERRMPTLDEINRRRRTRRCSFCTSTIARCSTARR